MIYLVLSLLTLALGPVLASLARRLRWTTLTLDAFVLLVLGGLVLLHILPHALIDGGLPALAAGIAAFLAAGSAERGLHRHQDDARSRFSRIAVPTLAFLGLGFHAVVDGLALRGSAGNAFGPHAGHDHGPAADPTWAIAVLAHRLPFSIGLWWIVAPLFGLRTAITTMSVIGAGTLVGYFGGAPFLASASPTTIAIFEAILSGTLLHVVLHADLPPAPRGAHGLEKRLATLAGLLLGGLVVYAAEAGHSHDHGAATTGEHAASTAETFLRLALESAPALLFAYLAIGLLDVFLPQDFVRRATNKGGSLSQALRGVAVGVPLPVCSCGVVPIYRDLVRRGSSPIAGIAFLIATPEIEIAAILLSLQLLGPELAVGRVVSAGLLAVLAALAVARFARPAPLPAEEEKKSCCATEAAAAPPRPGRLRAIWKAGFVNAVDETSTWILVGLGIAAILAPHLDPSWLGSLPSLAAVPLAAAIGMPLYVCASGSTPLAAVLVAQGLSPGAAVAFLLTGPATNVTTFGVLKNLHGARTATWFAGSVLVLATGLGLLVDVFVPAADARAAAMGHDHSASWWAWACLVALGGLVLASVLRQGLRAYLGQLFDTPTLPEIQAGDEGGHGHEHHHEHHHAAPPAAPPPAATPEPAHGCCHKPAAGDPPTGDAVTPPASGHRTP